MATPTRISTSLTGTLGDILVDVRTVPVRAPGPAVVLLHGFKGFKDWGFFPPLADRLARAGFLTVSYNASGSGVDDTGQFAFPDRFGHNTFSAELADVGIVLDALESGALGVPRPTALGLLGHSRGGGIAILEAAERHSVRALVTWAAIATPSRWPPETRRRWREAGQLQVTNQRTGEVLPVYPDILDDLDQHAERLDIAASAGRLSIPWLIVHGEVDETVPIAEGKALHAAAPRATFLPVPRASHTFGATHPLEGWPAPLVQVLDASVEFLGRHLP